MDGDVDAAREAAEAVLEKGPWPRVYFMKGGKGKPRLKRYLEDVKQGKVPTTWWVDDDYDEALEEHGHQGTQ